MSEYKTVAHLTPGHKWFELFPDGEVPIVSLHVFVFEVCPDPCYFVNGKKLNDAQVNKFAEELLILFPGMFSSLESAQLSVRGGFPMQLIHFCGVESNDPESLVVPEGLFYVSELDSVFPEDSHLRQQEEPS